MEEYIGLDVSMKETAVSVRRDGKRVWRGKCASDPTLLAALIRKHAPLAKRVVFETGPLSVWFYHALCAEGLPAICIDARHAKAALDMAANKTNANDADGLAHLAEVGFYREVRVKGFDSDLPPVLRTSGLARHALLGLFGREIPESRMHAVSIVISFDVSEQGLSHLGVRRPAALVDEFDLQRVEEALHRCVIVTVAGPAHGWRCTDRGELIDIGTGGVCFGKLPRGAFRPRHRRFDEPARQPI